MSTENVNVVYSADVAGYTRSLGEAIAVTEQYSKAAGGLGGALNNLATTMSTRVLTAARGFSQANQTLTGQAAAYQQALAPLEATAVAAGTGFKKLSEDTRRLAREFPVGIAAAVQSMRQLQQLGAPTRQLGSLATAMTELAGATGASLPQVTYEMTQLSRTFGNFNPRAVTGMADSLVTMTNKFGGSAESVLQFSNAIAPLAKQAGMGQSAVMGFATAFSRLGEDGYRSANAFNKMLLDMDRSVREGSDTMRVYANTVDMTVDEFKKMFALDPASALTSVIEGLNKQGPGAIRTLEQMGLEGTRTLSSITNLVQSGNLKEIQNTALASYGSGASKEAAEVAFGGLNDQLTKLNETLSQVGAQAGRPFLSFMEKAAAGATGLAGAFEGLLNNRFVQFLIGGVGAVAGVGGLALKGGSAAIGAGGILQLLGMGAKDGQPNRLVRALGSPAGKVGMVGAAGAFGLAQMSGIGGDLPLGLLSLGALGAYGRFGRGRGAGMAAGGFRAITDMFMMGPLMAAANPRAALTGGLDYSSLSDEQRNKLRATRMLQDYGVINRQERFQRDMQTRFNLSDDERKAATSRLSGRTAARYATGGLALVGGGLRTAATSAWGLMGGGLGLGITAAGLGYSTYAASKAAGEETRASFAADPVAALNEFRNATGRATEQMASLAREEASATEAITAVTSANQTLADAARLTARELERLADWEAALPEDVMKGSAEQVASQVTALTIGNPEDIALALMDVAKTRGSTFAEEVGGIVATRGVSGDELRKAGLATLEGATQAELGGVMAWTNVLPGPSLGDLLKGAEKGAAVGGLAAQPMVEEQRRAEEMGGLGARVKTQDAQVREVIALSNELVRDQGRLSNTQKAALETTLETIGLDEALAKQLIKDTADWSSGVEDATKTWEQSDVAQQAAALEGSAIRRGTEAERRIRSEAGIGAQVGYFGGSAMVSQGSIAAESAFGFMDKLREANVDLTEAVEANTNGTVNLTEAELAIADALNNPESAGKMLTAAVLETENLTAQGLSLQQQEREINRMIDTGQYAEGDPRLIQLQTQRARVQQLRGVERQGMTRTQRWTQAAEDWQAWQDRPMPTSEAQVQERQAAEQNAMAAEEEQRQFMLSRLKAQEEFQHQMSRSASDFARSQIYAQQDFDRSMARQQHDFNLQMTRAEEDFNISRARANEDYYINRNRSVTDFNRSMAREAADHQRQMERLAVDTAKSMANPYQRIFGEATYSPAGLASNLREQEKLFREQMQTLDKLRERGMSQEAIDVLGLAEAGNAQQAITMGEASRADIRRLNRLASRRVGLGGQFRDESLSVRRSEEDRQIALDRQRQDMRRNLLRGDRDFRRSLARQDADFKRSIGRAQTDFATATARANEDFLISSARAFEAFQIQMTRAQEDLERSFRDINGDMETVTKAYRKFVKGEAVTLEGLTEDTSANLSSIVDEAVNALNPPEEGEYKLRWKRFAKAIKDGIDEEGFDLGQGIQIYLGVGGGGGGLGGPATGALPGKLTAIGGDDKGALTSPFMAYNPGVWSWNGGYHNGQDFSPSAGPIFASVDGTVLESGNFGTYAGNHVTLVTADGAQVTYAHMQTGSNLPRQGQYVKEGTRIGLIGETGNTRGAHLHVDVWKNGTYVNPLPYLADGAIVDGEQQVKVGEHGSEAVIPLNERGLAFMTQALTEVARHVDGVAVGASQAARYSQTTVYNNQRYSYDQSTRFTGPVTVQADDPKAMASRLAARARRDRALNGVGT